MMEGAEVVAAFLVCVFVCMAVETMNEGRRGLEEDLDRAERDREETRQQIIKRIILLEVSLTDGLRRRRLRRRVSYFY